MLIGPDLKNQNGTILIVVLWALVILTVFALALGQRASLEIRLAEYQRDSLRAVELAKAAIERGILEKELDKVLEIDALSESWANNQSVFKSFELGEGAFTVSYSLDGSLLYGIQDEESKININKVELPVLLNLLESYEVEDAEELANSILVWRGTMIDPDEESNYEDSAYPCKGEEVKSVAELLLVRGMSREILYGEDKDEDNRISEDEKGIAEYLTVYGRGRVNINTASETVLSALIGAAFPDLAKEIVEYRKGDDEIAGTDDDQWFAIGVDTVELDTGEMKEVKNLISGEPGPFELPGWARLKHLAGTTQAISVTSKTYRIFAQAEVKKARKSLTATIDLSEPGKTKYLAWGRN